MAALHLATRVFSAGNHISDEQRDKEKDMRASTIEEKTKFETFKRTNPREKT